MIMRNIGFCFKFHYNQNFSIIIVEKFCFFSFSFSWIWSEIFYIYCFEWILIEIFDLNTYFSFIFHFYQSLYFYSPFNFEILMCFYFCYCVHVTIFCFFLFDPYSFKVLYKINNYKGKFKFRHLIYFRLISFTNFLLENQQEKIF